MQQQTEEWFKARLGKATASRIGDLMAKTRTGWGASRKNYAAELVAERLTGEPTARYQNNAMAYGLECEPEARAAYSFQMNVDVIECGFVAHPSIEAAGASPDGYVGDDGLVEVKAPNTATHIDTLIRETIDGGYLLQMQFQLATTGRKYCDFVSYDKRLPEPMRLFIKRVWRDDKQIAEIEKEVRIFLAEIDETVASLLSKFPMVEAA